MRAHRTLAAVAALAAAGSLASAGTAPGTTWNFDFGYQPTDRNGDFFTPGGWNNIDYFRSFYFGLVDSNENVTNMTLEWDGFYDIGSNSLGSEAPSGDAANFPVTATDDFLFGHDDGWAGNTGHALVTLTISGLDTGIAYDFGFFGSRAGTGDVRSARFDVEGENFGTTSQDSRGNDSNVATVDGIFADSTGTITVFIQKDATNDNGDGFFYLNVMTITAVPAPGGAALLAGAGLLAARRRR